MGIEPATFPLPWECSTTELRRRIYHCLPAEALAKAGATPA